jgi:hypothetical protein
MKYDEPKAQRISPKGHYNGAGSFVALFRDAKERKEVFPSE